MAENHAATAILVGVVLLAAVGAVQILRGLVLNARARRATVAELFEEPWARTRARARSALRVGAVCFLVAGVGTVLVYVSLH